MCVPSNWVQIGSSPSSMFTTIIRSNTCALLFTYFRENVVYALPWWIKVVEVCLGFWSWSWSLLESLKLMFGKIFGVLVWLIMFCSWSLLEIPKLTTGRESAFYRVGLVWTFFQNLQHRCQKIRERGWKVDRSEKIQVSQKRKDFNKCPKSFFSGHLMVDQRVLCQKVKSTSF